jgi:glycosyltransferase involved in cell wall biosynthesis
VLLCGEPSLVPQFEAARAGTKFFYCVLEDMPDERRIVHHAGWSLLANSSGVRERLRRKYGVVAAEAIGGLDPAVFHPTMPDRPDRPEPFRILAYGRTSRPRKGTRLVVRAAERLARSFGRRWPPWAGMLAHPVQLVLFDHLGPGNESDPRREIVTTLPIEFHLDLDQARLAALYRSCDVFVSAERRAGWNNTVAEAMGCGTAVVCTRSGTRDVARHRETAWVVPIRHPWFLARGLAAVARDPALRRGMRTRAARQMAQFTWDRVAERLEFVSRAARKSA